MGKKFMGYDNASELLTAIGNKIKAKYTKPNTGIPKSDLASGVQTSLGKADTAVQNSSLVDTIDNGVKNVLNVFAPSASDFPQTMNGLTATLQSDGSIRVTGTPTTSSYITFIIFNDIRPFANDFIGKLLTGSLAPSGNVRTTQIVIELATSPYTAYAVSENTTVGTDNEISDFSSATSSVNLFIRVYPINTTTAIDVTYYPMICTKSQFDISNAYQPYALPNYDLTRLEAEDRASLAEVVDSGAKNLVDLSSFTGYSDGSLTMTKASDGTITVTGTVTGSFVGVNICTINLTPGTYVLTGCPEGGGVNTWQLDINNGVYEDRGNGVVFTVTSTMSTVIRIRIATTSSSITKVFKPMICSKAAFDVSQKFVPYRPNWDLVSSVAPFYSVPINHNMIYRGQNLGATFTDAQHTALSSGNFTDLYLGDYWTKSVTIPDFYELTTAQPSDWTTNYTSYYTKSGNTYTAVTGSSAPTWAADTYYTKSVPTQTVTLKAVIADFDTFYAGYASSYAGINTHHAGVIVTGFDNVVWNKTNSTAGGYVASLIHKWLVGSVLPQLESWFGSAKVLSHQKLLTNAITGDAASGWAWSSQKISLLSECQLYGMKVWGGSKATNGAYEPGEAFKKLDVFNHIDANLLFGNKNIWCRDIASAEWAAHMHSGGYAYNYVASNTWIAPAALILLS